MLTSTIYVSIASMYDLELIPTIHDAFSKASNPSRIYLGIALLDSNEKLYKKVLKEINKYGDQVSLDFTKIKKNKELDYLGVGKGRKRAHAMYADQDYFLQIDSHTMFHQDWDKVLISLHKESVIYNTKNPKTILTGYAGMYFVDENQNRHLGPIEEETLPAGFLYPNFVRLEKNGPVPRWSMTEISKITKTEDRFIPAVKFNANFAFGNRYFGKNPGIPEGAVFFEEEIMQSVSLMSMGFSLAFPTMEYALIRHLYVAEERTKDGVVVSFGGRKAANDYMSPEQRKQQQIQVFENYDSFVNSPELAKYISAYEKYAGISLRHGKVSVETQIPDRWLLDEELIEIDRVDGDCN